MLAARDFLTDMDQSLSAGAEDARLTKLARILDLMNAVPGPLPAELDGIFENVILRLSADLGIPERTKIARRLALMPNAPQGVLRQFAHDKLPVARPVIAAAQRLGNDDLVSVAESRGQPHMRVIADRPHLVPVVTDILVVRGDQDVVSAVAGNKTASFSDNGLQELATRAVTDERLFEALAEREDISVEKLSAMMQAAQAALNADMASLKVQQGLTDAVASGSEKAINRAANSLSDRMAGLDEAAVERLIAMGSLTEEHISCFIGEKRLSAIIMCMAEMARIDVSTAERLINQDDPEGIIYLCRSLDFSWMTTRALIMVRPGEVIRLDKLESMTDLYHATTPQMARRIFAFRFSGS
jgi:uncharacterized protein (DUF2336 family)